MGMIAEVLNMIIIILIARSILNIFARIIIIKRAKNQNETMSQSPVDGTTVKPTLVEIPLVKDEICGKKLERNKAYIINKDDKEHYFCSWECREQFIKIIRQESLDSSQ